MRAILLRVRLISGTFITAAIFLFAIANITACSLAVVAPTTPDALVGAPVAVNDHPELEFDSSAAGWSSNVSLGGFQGVAAFRFTVFMAHDVYPPTVPGILYISKNAITYAGTGIDEPNLTFGRVEIQFLTVRLRQGGIGPQYIEIKLNNGQTHKFDLLEHNRNNEWETENSVDTDINANACLSVVAPWMINAWNNFDGTVARFESLTRNLPVSGSLPLSSQLQARLTALETEADSNAALGRWSQAFGDYTHAMKVLPDVWAPQDIKQRLQDKTINAALHLSPPPEIPQAAEQHEIFGKTAVQTASRPTDLYGAINELKQAVRIAPWWADGYYNLAVVLEKAKMYGAAADALQWYLRAAPNAQDAASVKLKIYNLQYKQSQQHSSS